VGDGPHKVDFETTVLPHLSRGWVESVRAEIDEFIRRRGTEIVDSEAQFPCYDSSRPHVATLLATEVIANEMTKAIQDALYESNMHIINDLAPGPVKERVLRELRAHPERRRQIAKDAAESLRRRRG